MARQRGLTSFTTSLARCSISRIQPFLSAYSIFWLRIEAALFEACNVASLALLKLSDSPPGQSPSSQARSKGSPFVTLALWACQESVVERPEIGLASLF